MKSSRLKKRGEIISEDFDQFVRRGYANNPTRLWTEIVRVRDQMVGQPADEVYAQLVKAVRASPERLTVPDTELREAARLIAVDDPEP